MLSIVPRYFYKLLISDKVEVNSLSKKLDQRQYSLKNWMLILVLLCENERQRRDASRYIKARSEAQTKINIQNL